jgi:hypothetical protein
MSSKQKANDMCSCGSGKKYKKCCKFYNELKTIQSVSMKTESNRCSGKTEFDIVEEYIKLPRLPTNSEINIDKIGIYNYDSNGRKSADFIKYSTFTSINPTEYQVGKNPSLDYMPDEYVSPVIIINTDGIKYKVDDFLWFPLSDIHDGILIKQGITCKKIFPTKIFIDEIVEKTIKGITNKSCKWIITLQNLVGFDILNKLPPQK